VSAKAIGQLRVHPGPQQPVVEANVFQQSVFRIDCDPRRIERKTDAVTDLSFAYRNRQSENLYVVKAECRLAFDDINRRFKSRQRFFIHQIGAADMSIPKFGSPANLLRIAPIEKT
jgi:hypothetical protein